MAPNHVFGRRNPVRASTATLVIAILITSTMTALGQQPSAAQLKEHAQNAVKIISGDRQKIDAYCEFADLTDKFDQAVEEENTQKAEELFQKGEELQRKLGPEFAALADGIRNADVSSQDVREITSTSTVAPSSGCATGPATSRPQPQSAAPRRRLEASGTCRRAAELPERLPCLRGRDYALFALGRDSPGCGDDKAQFLPP
jgi:hypothetical protein